MAKLGKCTKVCQNNIFELNALKSTGSPGGNAAFSPSAHLVRGLCKPDKLGFSVLCRICTSLYWLPLSCIFKWTNPSTLELSLSFSPLGNVF